MPLIKDEIAPLAAVRFELESTNVTLLMSVNSYLYLSAALPLPYRSVLAGSFHKADKLVNEVDTLLKSTAVAGPVN